MHKLNDPVYPHIPISEVMHALMHLPTIRHLKEIWQLGFVSDIYPSAENSRYPHSLGVSYTVRRMGEVTGLSDDLIRVGEAAAIFHDLHYPYSHPTDIALATRHEEIACNALRSGERFGYVDGAACIKALVGVGIAPLDVVAVLENKHPVLSQYLSGALLDADKIDYVPRDQRSASLTKTETQRLLCELVLIEGELGIRGDAVTNMSDLLHGKAKSTERMYFHKRVHAAETALRYAVEEDERIQTDLPRARNRIHRMTQSQFLSYLAASRQPFVRELAHRLQSGYVGWFDPVYAVGGSQQQDAVRQLVTHRPDLRAALLAEGFLLSTHQAQLALGRIDKPLPRLPVREDNGEVYQFLERHEDERAAYQRMPARAVVVYAPEATAHSRARAEGIVQGFVR